MKRLQIIGILLALVATSGCELILDNPNNPAVDDVVGSPSANELAQSAVGLAVVSRTGKIGLTGRIAAWGVFGRENLIFDAADPRFITEFIGPNADDMGNFPDRDLDQTTLDPQSFGGAFWTVPYRNLQQGEILLELTAADGLAADVFSPEETAAYRGWVRWIQALALEELVVSHLCPPAIANEPLCNEATQQGAFSGFFIGVVLDWENVDYLDESTYTAEALNTNAPLSADWDSAMAKVEFLLSEAATELAAAGDASFPFSTTSGYTGFNTPATLSAAVNAMRARIALYRDDFDGALGFLDDSFLSEDPATWGFANGGALAADTGVFHTYSTDPGDASNGLSPITVGASPTIFAHPDVTADAEVGDLRVANRFVAVGENNGPSIPTQGLPDPTLIWAVYPTLESPVPIIRNEELVLIKIEALARSGSVGDAVTLLNAFRAGAAGLPALDPAPADADAVLLEVLGERKLSLGFQGGHRLIDAKRTGTLDLLPRDRPSDAKNVVYPISPAETNARNLGQSADE